MIEADKVQARVKMTNLLPAALAQVAEESLVAICTPKVLISKKVFLKVSFLFKTLPANIFPSDSSEIIKR